MTFSDSGGQQHIPQLRSGPQMSVPVAPCSSDPLNLLKDFSRAFILGQSLYYLEPKVGGALSNLEKAVFWYLGATESGEMADGGWRRLRERLRAGCGWEAESSRGHLRFLEARSQSLALPHHDPRCYAKQAGLAIEKGRVWRSSACEGQLGAIDWMWAISGSEGEVPGICLQQQEGFRDQNTVGFFLHARPWVLGTFKRRSSPGA